MVSDVSETADGKKTPSAPRDLGASGRRFFREIVADFELEPHETAQLVHVCRVLDTLTRLDEAIAGADLIEEGSRGQSVINPLVGEARQQRDLLSRMLSRLQLPPPDSEEGDAPKSYRHQRAANARWSRGAAGSSAPGSVPAGSSLSSSRWATRG